MFHVSRLKGLQSFTFYYLITKHETQNKKRYFNKEIIYNQIMIQ
jgi:hypothetical protein